MDHGTRRNFLRAFGVALAPAARRAAADAGAMRMGFVTYQWGKDMDLPTLLRACEHSGLLAVELRTGHAHGVEPPLTKTQRGEVRKRFADSPVKLIGYGSNCEFHSPDPAQVKENIEQARRYIQLMHDCGGSGVKVKPNDLPDGVPARKTIGQIGQALNEVAAFGAEYGQKIRLEVHGRRTSELPTFKQILDVATHPNLYVCWNSNANDLKGAGLEANFSLVKARLGDTVHIHELDAGDYPFPQLFALLKEAKYQGWLLLEASSDPPDKPKAMAEQLGLFKRMMNL